ncbi:MAG: hypothetical protein A2169_12290 [Deltaproteobacteria bacterium RBG_13_47_9]|nr:MAG: hypothetical protein A2169_12290 [Deltaproteobacteria bacterium RBG_13_47_9]
MRHPVIPPGPLTIHWPEKKVLLAGDLIFYGGIGRTDLLEGNPRLLRGSIERISYLDMEILLPGHGKIVTGKEAVLRNVQFIRQNFYPYL